MLILTTIFFDENQWEINQRTNVNTGEKQDFSQIETWSKLDFKNYFAQHLYAFYRWTFQAKEKIKNDD